jgi:hypothetical protein
MGVQMIRKIDAFLYAAGIIGVGLIAYAWPVRAQPQCEACVLLPAIARSEGHCGPWDNLKSFLAEKHHEVEVGGGFIGPTIVTVLFMSPDGDTWSMVALGTDDQACIVQSGRDWFQRSIPSADERPS